MSDKCEEKRPHVAIIGSGLVGVILALGLLKRNIKVTLYEQSHDLNELGAGIAFTGVAQECMRQLDPRILEALRRVGNENVTAYNRYVDGYSQVTGEQREEDSTFEPLFFQLPIDGMKFWACHRAHFLNELAKLLPGNVIVFQKRLATYVDDENRPTVMLHFEDGSMAEVDAVIGCDGIKSRVRQVLLGPDNPASLPSYTHRAAYRAVVPIEAAAAAIGTDKANNQCLHMGPGSHVLNYPLANYTLMNIVIFLRDWDVWPNIEKMAGSAHKTEVASAFAHWGPAVRSIIELLPEELAKWAIFDLGTHPVPFYAKGRVCMAGDAAHGSAPHHGAGAGFGVEDALALASILEEMEESTHIVQALHAFSSVRYERTQWLVRSSRETADIYEWTYHESGSDPDKCKEQIEQRTRKIWDYDVDAMVTEAKEVYRASFQFSTVNK